VYEFTLRVQLCRVDNTTID